VVEVVEEEGEEEAEVVEEYLGSTDCKELHIHTQRNSSSYLVEEGEEEADIQDNQH